MACWHHQATEGTQADAAGAGSSNLRAPTGPTAGQAFPQDDTTDLPGANQMPLSAAPHAWCAHRLRPVSRRTFLTPLLFAHFRQPFKGINLPPTPQEEIDASHPVFMQRAVGLRHTPRAPAAPKGIPLAGFQNRGNLPGQTRDRVGRGCPDNIPVGVDPLPWTIERFRI